MGPYYLTMLVNLIGPGPPRPGDRHQRPGRAADHRAGPEARHALPGRHADQHPVAARVRRRRHRHLRRIAGTSSATPTTRSSCTAPTARCACPIPTPSAASSRSPTAGADWHETDTAALPYGAPNWPSDAPGPRQLPDARPRRPRARRSPRAAAPRPPASWRCTCSRSWRRSCAPARPARRRSSRARPTTRRTGRGRGAKPAGVIPTRQSRSSPPTSTASGWSPAPGLGAARPSVRSPSATTASNGSRHRLRLRAGDRRELLVSRDRRRQGAVRGNPRAVRPGGRRSTRPDHPPRPRRPAGTPSRSPSPTASASSSCRQPPDPKDQPLIHFRNDL